LTRVTRIFQKSVFTETTPAARAGCRAGLFVARPQAAAAPGVFWCDNKRLGDLSDLTPSEAADLAKVIDVYVGALATKGCEERLTKLENATER